MNDWAADVNCWQCGSLIPGAYRGMSYYHCKNCDVTYREGISPREIFTEPHPGYIDHATAHVPSPA